MNWPEAAESENRKSKISRWPNQKVSDEWRVTSELIDFGLTQSKNQKLKFQMTRRPIPPRDTLPLIGHRQFPAKA
jgi:hypothetical protein